MIQMNNSVIIVHVFLALNLNEWYDGDSLVDCGTEFHCCDALKKKMAGLNAVFLSGIVQSPLAAPLVAMLVVDLKFIQSNYVKLKKKPRSQRLVMMLYTWTASVMVQIAPHKHQLSESMFNGYVSLYFKHKVHSE